MTKWPFGTEPFHTEPFHIVIEQAAHDLPAGVLRQGFGGLGSLAEHLLLLLGDGNSWPVALKQRIPVWTSVSSPFARLSRSLPIFDIWPYRHHTCFQLREGGQEVLMSDPTFFENYESVGQFPGVQSNWTAGKARILGSFAGFARPLL